MLKTDWYNMILAFFHDPPDKALDIRGHVSRGAKLAGVALGEEITRETLSKNSKNEDITAAEIERLPMPRPDINGEYVWAVSPDEEGELVVVHPLSAEKRVIDTKRLTFEAEKKVLSEIINDSTDRNYFAIWRLYRDRLARLDSGWMMLPADTRQPDHSIWNHTDFVSGLLPSLTDVEGPGFLTFQIGPVQPFIAASRSLRDLWSSSFILSWLAFHAALPLIENLGPASLVYPSMRGVPMLDKWLQKEKGLPIEFDPSTILSPCLPNRFLAVVPWGRDGETARKIAAECEQSAKHEWLNICNTVKQSLAKKWNDISPQWAVLWDEQVESYFEFNTSLLHRRECNDNVICELLSEDGKFSTARPNAAMTRKLAAVIPLEERPGYPQNTAGRWGSQIDIIGRSLAAKRTVRHFPRGVDWAAMTPAKCSMLGTFEQMGPPLLSDSSKFWEKVFSEDAHQIRGTRLKTNEQLCAVALVKRFAWPCYFQTKLGVELSQRRIEDTATIAAAEWIRRPEVNLDVEAIWKREKYWSGQWLHKNDKSEEHDLTISDSLLREIRDSIKRAGSPPTYYAVLKLDGDELGKWLQGEKSPPISDVIHPHMHSYWKDKPAAAEILRVPRPVGPTLHASISEALANFSLHFAPQIVEKHKGTLIYAGGDDVLALLPVSSSLACAQELETTYRSDWHTDSDGNPRLLMGSKATVSCGIAIVHYKEDLAYALEQARSAEKAAKSSGRNCLAIATCKRSGEHNLFYWPWKLVPNLRGYVETFMSGATDRWAYRLRQQLHVLRALPLEAFVAEMKRLVDRTQNGEAATFDSDRLTSDFADYLSCSVSAMSQIEPGDVERDFVFACQAASFMARGRDE